MLVQALVVSSRAFDLETRSDSLLHVAVFYSFPISFPGAGLSDGSNFSYPDDPIHVYSCTR